ncbi:MAG TPA: hypothetical protein VHT91_20380 [Kofleriaceae bacterium]|nr:hypothetical protein [Kofleriaceae bacterium]
MITLALVAACSGARNATGPQPDRKGSGAGSGEVAAPGAKRFAVSWGIEQHGGAADLFLATTDETGKQVSHPLGTYQGVCSVITPAREMNAVTGVGCKNGATGTELHAIVEHDQEIVVVKLRVDEGVKQDPMAREEVTRIKVPLGAKLQIGA